jgi:predicted exporter
MFDECFSILFDGCSRRKRLITGLAAGIAVAAALGLGAISLENDLELMLPADEGIRRSMRFLQESHFSDDVIISLGLRSAAGSPEKLLHAAKKLERSLGPPLVTGVVSGASGADVVGETRSLLRHLPELLDEEALSRIDQELTAEGVDRNLRRSYRQLVRPVSTFLSPFLRGDPLGLSLGVLGSFQKLSSSLGYRVDLRDGRFISRDGTHTMLVIKTPVRIADASGARELVSYLRERLRELPDSVSADIIAGHLHTISNEDVIKRDVWSALAIASIGFFCLFVLLFRDLRAALLFLLPVAAVLVSINLSNLVLSRLSYFIIGMGGVVTGISVDYGIHVYMAVRSGHGRAEAVKRVAKPVVTGAVTTLSVFAAFFFSSVEGYHQLALFSILSIALCLASALFLLPHLISGALPIPGVRWEGEGPVERSRGFRLVVVACWAVAMIAASLSMGRLGLDTDLRRLDGSESWVTDAEKRFHRVWGGESRPAIFVVPGRTLEEALRRNARVYADARSVGEGEEFASLSAVWPSREERIENRARWIEFWKQGRESKLRRLLGERGPTYGFSEDAFAPFFEGLYLESGTGDGLEGLAIFARLKERFLQEGPEGYQLLSFFPDRDRPVSRLSEISERHPGTFVVSRNAISRALSRSVSSEIVYLFGVAALLVPILALLLLRSVRLTALALVPVVTGVVAILGMVPALGLSLDAPSLISAMVAIGLCIDYGIFMVYQRHYHLETGTQAAVTLSALTTLIGAGALLFARHPLLFSVGSTMVTGVLAGYLSAMLVLPSLHHWIAGDGARPRR